MPTKYLGEDDRAIRYVPWGRLRKDEDDNVVGILGAAFQLRAEENELSATWQEYFEGTADEQFAQAIAAIRSSNLKPTTKSGFAIGVVSRVRAQVDKPINKLRFVHDPEDDNKAHTSIKNWPREDDLLDLIAGDSWSTLVLNKDIP